MVFVRDNHELVSDKTVLKHIHDDGHDVMVVVVVNSRPLGNLWLAVTQVIMK